MRCDAARVSHVFVLGYLTNVAAFDFVCDSRTFLSIIGGVIAGIMGFTSFTGFIFYLFVMALTSLALVVKSNFKVPSYFDGWNRVLFDGFLSGLMVSIVYIL